MSDKQQERTQRLREIMARRNGLWPRINTVDVPSDFLSHTKGLSKTAIQMYLAIFKHSYNWPEDEHDGGFKWVSVGEILSEYPWFVYQDALDALEELRESGELESKSGHYRLIKEV